MSIILDSAFHGSSALNDITIPDSVTTIGSGAFSDCLSLTSVTIPKSVKSIGEKAFDGCASLSAVAIYGPIPYVHVGIFYGCSSLRLISFPSTVTYIGEKAFYECTSLAYIEIPSSVTSIGRDAFSFCGSLKKAVVPSSLSIAEYTFPRGTVIERMKGSSYMSNNTNKGITGNGERQVETTKSTSTTVSDVDKNIPTSTTVNKNTFAVVIGNENYQRVTNVDYALNDAKVFAAYCRKTLGLPENNIRIYEDATYGTMLTAIDDIKQISAAYKGNLNVIFYYAGHGIPNATNHNAYLLPVDVDGSRPDICLSVAQLYKDLNSLNARKVVVFMDACFSGAQRGDGMLASSRGVALKVKDEAPQGNMIVFTAATGDQTAYPYKEQKHGMFTYFLLKKLKETKGDVTLGQLCDFVQTQVGQQSIVLNGKSQTPTVIPSRSIGTEWRKKTLK